MNVSHLPEAFNELPGTQINGEKGLDQHIDHDQLALQYVAGGNHHLYKSFPYKIS